MARPVARDARAAPLEEQARNPWEELAASEQQLRLRFQKDIAQLRARLAIFDADALAAGIGGLHLVAANAPFSARLAIAARLAAERSGHTGIPPEWNWINGWALDHWGLGALDDPLEDLFCDEMGFTDGPYLVLPSNFGDDMLPTKHLVRVLLARSEHRRTTRLEVELGQLTTCVLRLSDAMARRAGLRRGIGDEVTQRRDVEVPARRTLQQLASAVRFSLADLAAEVDPDAMRHLAPLFHEPPAVVSDEALTHNGLGAQPLRRTDDGIIVAFPRQLLTALRHRLCVRVSSHTGRRQLALALHRSLAEDVDLAARRMGWVPLESKAARVTRGAVLSWRRYAFDANAIANVAIVIDALERYVDGDVNPPWPTDGLFARIDRDLRSFARRASTNVLSVSLTQSIGRYSQTGNIYGAKGRHRWLSLGIDDFRVIGVLEAANPVALWKFAAACADVSRVMRVRSWDVLSLYESHRRAPGGLHALLGSEAERPTTLVFQPGSGSTLKLQISKLIDPHLERFPDPPVLVEVARPYAQRGVPIYEPVYDQRPMRVVDALGGPIWIRGPEDLVPDTDAYDVHDAVADVIAYWLWQLDAAQGGTPVARDPRFVDVRVPDVSDWEQDNHAPREGPIVRCASTAHGIRLELLRGAAARCSGPDNTGEREIVRALVDVLLDGDADGHAHAVALLDVAMPVGPKRRIPRADDRPHLHPRGLPPMRGLQAFDELALNRVLGRHLRNDLQLRAGIVAGAQRTTVLNAAVAWCFQQLADRVARLRPERLLDVLVLYHERLIYEDFISRNSVESEVRCWSSAAEVEARLRESIPRFASLLTASRFLIEYATAQPPAGAEPLGLAAYDELLAIANRIVELGMNSDAIRYGVVAQAVTVDREGLLSFHGTDDSARAARDARRALARDAVLFATLPVDPGGSDERQAERDPTYAAAWDRVNRAFADVEGFSVEEVAHGLNTLLDALRESRSEVLRLSVDAAVQAIASACTWSGERAERFVNSLSLAPRPDFLRAPSGEKADGLPWKYNRTYAYVRRPLLRSGNEILFGERHVVSAKMHLFQLCREGRLRRAPGTELDRALNAMRQLDGRAFNDYVAARFTPPRFRVDRRVSKIGGERLQRSGAEPIGDIDVLVADTTYRVLCSIDTKDHAPGRTPREIANEIEALFGGTPGKPSMVAAHLERDAWLRGHVKDALRHLRLDPAESHRWRVNSMLVFDEALASIARRSPVELLTITELETRLAVGGPLVRATNRASRERGRPHKGSR